MLDKDTFAATLDWLAERFHRDLPKRLVRSYYEMLAPHLTTEEFEQAARTIYFHDQFWPAPARFQEAIGSDADSHAHAEWETVLDLVRAGDGIRPSDAHPALANALRAIGGTTQLGQTREDRLPFVKREFITAYKAHAKRETAAQLEDHTPPELPGVF